MNLLQRALIEKAGHDHGFEYVLPSADGAAHLASALHRAQVRIVASEGRFELTVVSAGSGLLQSELARSFPSALLPGNGFVAVGQDGLAALLRRVADLAHALPNQAAIDFETKVKAELGQFPAELIRGTEVERLVRQRVGQQTFRQAMLEYWGGACAVTGISQSDVLRASHAKPWAECDSDAERLDVFNGFLLSANLDALFDRFLITFSCTGNLLVAPAISARDRELLGLDEALRLRWLAGESVRYLMFHQRRFELVTASEVSTK
jgi:hypothetical protein